MNSSEINEFRNQLAGIDGKLFLSVYKNCIGSPDSPYNRGTLTDSLVLYFKNTENREKIADSMDTADALICFLCDIISPCPESYIHAYLGKRIHTPTLGRHIASLIERGILFSDSQNLSVNALLSGFFAQNIYSLGFASDPLLFTQAGDTCEFFPSYWEQDRFIAAPYLLAAAAIFTKTTRTENLFVKEVSNSVLFFPDDEYARIIAKDLTDILYSISEPLKGTEGRKPGERRLSRLMLSDLLGLSDFELSLCLASLRDTAKIPAIRAALEQLSAFGKASAGRLENILKLNLLRTGISEFEDIPKEILKRLCCYNLIRGENGMYSFNAGIACGTASRSAFTESGAFEFEFHGKPLNEDASLAFLCTPKAIDVSSSYRITAQGLRLLNDAGYSAPDFGNCPMLRSSMKRFNDEANRFSLNSGYLLSCTDSGLIRALNTVDDLKDSVICKAGESAFLLSAEKADKWLPIITKFIPVDLKFANSGYDRKPDTKRFILDYAPLAQLPVSDAGTNRKQVPRVENSSAANNPIETAVLDAIGRGCEKMMLRVGGKLFIVKPLALKNGSLAAAVYPNGEKDCFALDSIENATAL